MNTKGRVLLVGAEAALVAEIRPSMAARDYELISVAEALEAVRRIKSEAYAAVIVDFAKIPPPDRESLARLQQGKAGFALFGIESSAQMSPSFSASLRRVPWPLPAGFLDQVRSVEVPVVFLVEPALFITQGMQGILRSAGVQSFQMESVVGVIEMIKEQAARLALARQRQSDKGAGFWARLSGGTDSKSNPEIIGRVAVVKFSGSAAESSQFDARLRQALPNAACYMVTAIDPLRAAAVAVTNGQPVLLLREHAVRISEILADAAKAGKTTPRGKERLLIVDNDLATLSRLTEVMLALGYEVVATENGEDALKLATLKPFHLAAIGGSALETKNMSGANLALKLRENDKDLRIILMVDQFPVQDALKGVSRAVELGLDDAVLKPIDASRLVLSIQRALERRFLILENARLLQEVQVSARKLAEVNGFQTKFFATVAHDVKNPLTAILGYAEVLANRLKDKPDDLRCATHINNAAKTLNLLVSDLVDLAAIESGKLRVELGALDIASVIQSVKARVDLVTQNKQLSLNIILPQGLPALKGDPHRIGQVIQNLCTNAIQYTKEGGRVSIEAALLPGWVVVGVRDTGIGISKEDLPRVWERFFQTKEAQTMRKAGFGLGLKIAREIVQMHGGEMGIESELGVGSFFYFKLPIPKAAPKPVSAAS